MKQLILIRGLPGSGKSTLAKTMQRGCWYNNKYCFHFEADMYFTDFKGRYNFDSAKLHLAHQWCQNQVEEKLRSSNSIIIIVSNMFTQMWQILPYQILAKKYEASLQLIECKGQFQSIHAVPDEVIKRMTKQWEDYREQEG